MARVSYQLVTLDRDAPIVDDLDCFELREPDPETLISFVNEQGFRTLKAKLASQMDLGDLAADPETDEITVDEVSYECVTDLATLQTWIEKAHKTGVVAVDTETTGLDAMAVDLVGVSFSIEAGSACYVPLAHGGGASGELALDLSESETPQQIALDDALAAMKPMLEDPAVLKVGQNIKYDMLILRRYGIQVAPIDDTMLVSYVLEAGLHGHGMDDLSQMHLDITPIPFKEVAGKGKNQITFDQVPLDKATDYAAEDADITGRLHRLLKPRLVKEKLLTVYETLERPLVSVLADMEHWGIKVEQSTLRRLSNEFAEGCASLESEIHALVGHEFNIASPKQLGEVLFGEMGLPGGRRSKTGAYSTNAAEMERLVAEGHELPAKVMEWRQLAKLKSTYTDALQKQINPQTGRVHTSFTLASTTTGRLSSNDPNLQNIPIRTEEGRKIRKAFVPEDGFTLLAADYSQIELRLLAHIADLDSLRDAFLAGLDIHAMTASEVFGVPIEGMDPMVRRQAKAINFGIIYGISAFGLANQLGCSRGDAKGFIDAYFERFPGIRHYMDETKAQAHEKGYVETAFGRRCHMRSINSKNPSERAFGERAAINAPIQGSAADVIRRAMIRMPDALDAAGLSEVRMLLQVHDELVFEVPEGRVEDATAVICETMEQAHVPALELSVPLTVDCGTGANWDEAH